MKHQLSAIVLATTLAMAMSGAASAATSADITQTGAANQAYAAQTNNSQGDTTATIVQSGAGNFAGNPDGGTVSFVEGGILQNGNYGNTTAEVGQRGNGNLAMVKQEGVTGKYGGISQVGDNNMSSLIEQGGSGGGASIVQSGRSNVAAVTLSGNGGIVDVLQSSQANKAEVNHISSGVTILRQGGLANTAMLDNQHVVGNLTVQQMGSGNSAQSNSLGSIVQDGNGNAASISGTGGGLTSPSLYNTFAMINQVGVVNTASISQNWSAGNGLASIDQSGRGNNALVYASGRQGGLIQIKQDGLENDARVTQSSFQGGVAYIEQSGNINTSTISQNAFGGGISRIKQNGNLNVAAISNASSSAADEASILQDGSRNAALITQIGPIGITGPMNKASIQQQGNDFKAAIYQAGSGNRAGILQR